MASFGKKRAYSRAMRLGTREREILDELTFGDMLVGMLCSGRSTRRMYKIARDRARERQLTKRAVGSLVSAGFITQHDDLLSLDKRGRDILEVTVVATRLRLSSGKWDGKWRIVIYDIPNEFDYLRYQVRSVLVRAGFKKLQKSVWVFPHECKQLSALIKKDDRLDKYIIHATIDTLDGDVKLRSLFNISR